MGRITTRRPVVRITLGQEPHKRADVLAAEEPLEIRVGGRPLAVTMRTPGHDVELAAGFLVSEAIIGRGDEFSNAIHCGGPGTGGVENTYNVLDVTLAPGVAPPAPEATRNFFTTSSCGVCGKASIEAIETVSRYDVAGDDSTVDAALVATFPDRLRAEQAVFAKTGGLHAAALFDAATGELLVVREDVGRHNAVDKVIGWAALHDRLPLRGAVLQVSGRTSFELVQKAVMAGIPILTAVSAPSSLAVELADASGLTLVGFLRPPSMNVYTRADRIRT
ncbi:formate dehydrogenase accessory sulfurtransferase FdhD [Microbacterium sp. cx-55]|uniref:formate dehydrogenase accessory sulfurtransferase FdhD n=1 Tax=Microbacterium sp. cx-55 TaxID=2875948 RepID=UPI001CC08F1E|nr:formate dehydrogenase accessory sulfurtransferase FdhD [Microbacterium sp. cx-55]MBZ4487969.1 formate dehydrogenase accessory sulfurtransferase FdhD [Microbacterium sp. cx-55]UGB34621.1 formate dehydrogenase accessory sulfurtransferase FdhD [Microbacterium sp. cx-55]